MGDPDFENKPNVNALWESVRKGSHQSFRMLYVEYSEILYNYGRKMCPDGELVRDSIQDVFKIIWEKRTHLEIKSSLKHYILTVFRRDLIMKIKKQHQNVSYRSAEFELSVELKIVLDEHQLELRENLNRAISKLTPRQREILFLRYYENMGFDEISNLMSLNHNSMYKLLSAALQRIKKYFLYMLLGIFWC